jgi:adenosylcobinamide kinase/adenosylcobinamide-phosphate guanylyltransferase
MLILVLGPVRSGKSARAAALARATRLHVIVAATAAEDADDREWSERIARHRRDRPQGWALVETASPEGPSLATLLREAPADACIVVDALGTWLAHELLAWNDAAEEDSEAVLGGRCAELIAALRDCAATTIVVAEETGWGVVPVTPLGRRFRDTLGRLAQSIGAIADRVELVVAGYAIDVRAIGTPISGDLWP